MTAKAMIQLPGKNHCETRYSIHDKRVTLLEVLADLIGCHEHIVPGFPDGTRPDVLRKNSSSGLLFIADAKNTETPGNTDTQVRLAKYLRWVATHVNSGKGSAIFSICFRRASDGPHWHKTLMRLATDNLSSFRILKLGRFDTGYHVSGIIVESNPQSHSLTKGSTLVRI